MILDGFYTLRYITYLNLLVGDFCCIYFLLSKKQIRSKKTGIASKVIMGCWPVSGSATPFLRSPHSKKKFNIPTRNLTARDFTYCPENHHMFICFDMILLAQKSAKQIADLLGSQLPWGHEFLVELSKAAP